MSSQIDSVPYKIGRNVARLRLNARLTQEQLAEKVDIGLRHLQRIEAGEKSPSMKTFVRIKKVLNVDWSDLFLGIG